MSEDQTIQTPPFPRRKPQFHPLPAGCSLSTLEGMIGRVFQGPRATQLLDLPRPALRMWPIPSTGVSASSHFGGLPTVPNGWRWPIGMDGPLWFIAQVNFDDIPADIRPPDLPSSGVMAFFGGYNDVIGSWPTGDCALSLFADPGVLETAAVPVGENFEVLRTCGMGFYMTWELPDRRSEAIATLGLTASEAKSYAALQEEVATHGFPPRWWRWGISKFYGWPDLYQHDLGTTFGGKPTSPFAQFGSFHDGEDSHDWGPGGFVYFALCKEGQYDRPIIEMQCN